MRSVKAISSTAFIGALVVFGYLVRVHAQVATVDATAPTSPQITYDPNPYIYPPPVPNDPTQTYLNIPTPTSIVGAVETKNTTALEADGLYAEGLAGATASYEDSSLLAQEPVVTTNNAPDTHTLSPAIVYYTPPPQPGGPYLKLAAPLSFGFGAGLIPAGYTRITAATAYGPTTGYGWGDVTKVTDYNRGGSDPATSSFDVVNGTPFFVDVPDGNYQVTITCGDASQSTSQVVRVNGLLERYTSGAGKGSSDTETFPVHARNGRLMLELFPYKSNYVCHINSLVIESIPEDHKPTIFVASDSTATKYSLALYPFTGWGDRLDRFLTDDVLVDDQAKPGRSIKSFYEEGGLDTIVDRIRPGDYLFIMSAINDAAKVVNKTGTESKDPARNTDPSTTYKAYLRLYVAAARNHGAMPVFITSQTKRTYDFFGRFYNSVGGYPQAMRELGAELNVPVIDLNQKSIDYLNAIGVDASAEIYMFVPAGMYPGWANGDSDYIHLQDNGATQYAHLIMRGVKELNIHPLAECVLDQARP